MAEIKIGTCSWKFPSWEGLVYSAPTGINYLKEYARRYRTVEIDQWFWSLFGTDTIGLPRPEDVQAYRQSVPDDFYFTVKAPNSVTLTHLYKKAKDDLLVANPHFLSAPLLRQFLSLLDPLRDLLGPIMFQFEYLNREKMASQDLFQEQFEHFVQQSPASYLYGLEIRNANYLNEAYFQFLQRNRLIPVFLEGYWMPPIAAVYQKHRSLVLAHQAVVIRLLGPDRPGMEEQTGKQWDKIVAPKDQDLAAIADMAKDLQSQDVDVYINVNNHYEGSAPLTIERLRQLL